MSPKLIEMLVNTKSFNIKYYRKEIAFATLFVTVIVGIIIYSFVKPHTLPGNKDRVSFDVKKGMTLGMIASQLYREKIIPAEIPFKVAGFIMGAENELKAGRYIIPDNISYIELVSLLKEGVPGQQIKVTIPEGIWQHKLAGLLHEKMGLDSAKFMELSNDGIFLKDHNIGASSLEGYLLPETYYFYSNSTIEDVILKLSSAMDEIFNTPFAQQQMKKYNMNKHQVLVLASIIDGESNIFSEFKRISGVYHNRLKKGMLLEADPTVQYLLRNNRRHNKIYYKDLEIDSPFNTYKYPGLPPLPINNPSKEAVMAALDPEIHNYYFFVADGTGGHKFAKTNREHNKNVKEYRKWRRSQ